MALFFHSMKYALQLEERVEATPKSTGVCPCCGSEMIAKCGNRKVWHWAHKTKQTCDHWWESETQWHREWKNRFPHDWQEVIHLADSGEKHIADVKTPDGLVIEFQHSYISSEERLYREKFYSNMIWIVDGRRTKNDLKRLVKLHEDARTPPWYYWREGNEIKIYDPEWYLPKAWLTSRVKVYFDFGYIDRPGDYEDGCIAPPWNSHLVCLNPESAIDNYRRSLQVIDRTRFLTDLTSRYNDAPF